MALATSSTPPKSSGWSRQSTSVFSFEEIWTSAPSNFVDLDPDELLRGELNEPEGGGQDLQRLPGPGGRDEHGSGNLIREPVVVQGRPEANVVGGGQVRGDDEVVNDEALGASHAGVDRDDH